MIYLLGIITGILLSLIAAVVSVYAAKRNIGIERIESALEPKATIFIPPEKGSDEERIYDLMHPE